MENANRTEAASDWRQAWRAFADRVGRPADTRDELEPAAVRVQPEETREEPFQGFDSPPGKF